MVRPPGTICFMTSPLARHLVLQHGWNSTAYQILNPGIQHWFSAKAPAVAGFVTRARTMVIAGAPVCALESLPVVTHELEQSARSRGHGICYFHASDRLAAHFRSSPRHSCVALGAQPVWNPADWPSILKSHGSLRAQTARARNKGVRISVASAASAEHDPLFEETLREWLGSRPMPPLRFLVEPETFRGELADRLLFTAYQHSVPIAYLLASPIPQRNGFLVEQLLRSPAAPNGTSELLIDALMNHLHTAGYTYLTLGLSPLCRESDRHLQSNPLWLRTLMGIARTHGRRFYDFDGLEKFRTKLCPSHWEPVYAITNERSFSPRSLYALLAAFSEKPLPYFAIKTIARCIGRFSCRMAAAACS